MWHNRIALFVVFPLKNDKMWGRSRNRAVEWPGAWIRRTVGVSLNVDFIQAPTLVFGRHLRPPHPTKVQLPPICPFEKLWFWHLKIHMDLCFFFLPQIFSKAAVAKIQSSKALWENLQCIWRAPYIHHFPSKKMGGILCILPNSGREIMPTCRCKKPPTIEE
jgi:hypothetical protein